MKLEIGNRKKTGKFTNVQIKQHPFKQQLIDQRRNHKKNQRILRGK